MTANRGLFVRNNGTVGTTPIEGRLVLASMLAENSLGVPRQGLLDQRATVVVSGTANMSYDVAACTPVLNRASNEGVYMFTLTGTTNVTTTAAPGTGSRWDLIYVKQSDLDKGDSVNTATVAVLQGTSSTGTPTKPTASLPAGAYVLAEALVNTGATATNGAQVTITQVWRYTALRGAPIPVRNTTERGEITPQVFTTVRRLDLGTSAIETYDGSSWILSGAWQHAEFTGPVQGTTPGSGSYWGTLTQDNATTFNNDFVASRTASGLGLTILKSGVYSIHGLWLPSTDPGAVSLGIHKNAGAPFATFSRSSTYGNWETSVSHAGTYLAANDYILFIAANSSGSNYGSRVTVTKLTS